MVETGYSYLSDNEKLIYRSFKKSFQEFSDTVDVGRNRIDKCMLLNVIHAVLGDNPQIVYFDKTKYSLSGSLIGGQKIALRRFGNAEKCKAMSEDVETAANMAVEEIELLNPISDYERLIYLYEYLQDNVLCDIEESKNLRMRRNSRNPMSHNAYGALINKKAVCDGVAAAFALIAQKMGYECIVVSGKATLETTEFSDHSWNIIRIGENYYHIDALWDINKKNQTGHYSYEYFGLNDVAVSIEHQWDITRSPVCGRTDLSFYLHNRCIANSLSQIDEIFERFARSRQGIVRLKVADGIAIPDSEEKYLGNRLLDVVSATGKYRSINFTWNKALRCFFGIMNQ